jgi:RNA polymerase sigma factor (sigma-70 family)
MSKVSSLIQQLKENDSKTIKKIYVDNRTKFIAFASKYNLGDEVILDVYQDAIIALCENARKGKLDNLQSSVDTYLFSIGKFMIYQLLKKNKKMHVVDDLNLVDYAFESYDDEKEDAEIKLLQTAFENLGEKCKKLIQLFYYEEKKLDEILTILNYNNKDVLKSQKSRCMKQLKDLIKNNNHG